MVAFLLTPTSISSITAFILHQVLSLWPSCDRTLRVFNGDKYIAHWLNRRSWFDGSFSQRFNRNRTEVIPIDFFRVTDKVSGLFRGEAQLLLLNYSIEKPSQVMNVQILDSCFATKIPPGGLYWIAPWIDNDPMFAKVFLFIFPSPAALVMHAFHLHAAAVSNYHSLFEEHKVDRNSNSVSLMDVICLCHVRIK